MNKGSCIQSSVSFLGGEGGASKLNCMCVAGDYELDEVESLKPLAKFLRCVCLCVCALSMTYHHPFLRELDEAMLPLVRREVTSGGPGWLIIDTGDCEELATTVQR